jgi:hypothetical protein
MALADLPASHMRSALASYEAGRRDAAARELDKSAALFRWGRLYAVSSSERRAYTAIVQKLEEDARRIRRGSDPGAERLEIDLALGYDVLAEDHLEAALEEWAAGEYVRVARLLDAAATEIEDGFSLSGAGVGNSIYMAEAAARVTSQRLASKQPPTEDELRKTIRDLGTSARSLGDVLGSRPH